MGDHLREIRDGINLLWVKDGCCHVLVQAFQDREEKPYWSAKVKHIESVANTAAVYGAGAAAAAKEARK